MTLQDLRQVMQSLLDIHGQHETQSLLKQKYHVELLDRYADGEYIEELQQYAQSYEQHQER